MSYAVGFPLGGFLATISLRLPFGFGAFVTFLGLVVTFIFLEESPSWERQDRRSIHGGSRSRSFLKNSTREFKPLPLSAKLLYIEGFFVGLSVNGMISLEALFLKDEFGFSPFETGLTLLPLAAIIFCNNRYGVPFLQNELGMYSTVIVGALVCGLGQIMVSILPGFSAVSGIYIHAIGTGCRMATVPAIIGGYTDMSNRAHSFSNLEAAQQIGSIFGPIIAGSLAQYNLQLYPWVALCLVNFIAALNTCIASFIQPHGDSIEARIERAVSEDVMSCKSMALLSQNQCSLVGDHRSLTENVARVSRSYVPEIISRASSYQHLDLQHSGDSFYQRLAGGDAGDADTPKNNTDGDDSPSRFRGMIQNRQKQQHSTSFTFRSHFGRDSFQNH